MIKNIIITNRCQVLTSRGICLGPVTVPFKEHVSNIFGMVCDERACIEEVLNDGSTLRLNIFNYDKDNQPAPVVEKVVKPYNPAIVEEVKEPIQPITEENTPVVEEVAEKEELPVLEEVEEVSETITEESLPMLDGEEAAEDSQQTKQNKQNYYKKNKNKK